MRLAAWFTARLLRLVLVLLCVAAVSFGLMMLSPIDPVDAYLGPQMAQVSPEQRALIAEQWGFDAPAMVQFSHWLRQLLSGELGWSHIYNQPVSEVIGQRFQRSFFLLFGAWLLSLALGMLLGIAAGSKEGAWLDRLISGYAYITASTPTFWLAMLALLLFSVTLGWTPTCCAGPMGVLRQEVGPLTRLHHLILPMATLALLGMATITLHTRAKMVAFMRSETALHAFAHGDLPDLLHHLVLPAITLAFASLGELFGGSLLIEQVFAYPGLGQATVAAGLRSDVPLLLAIALFTALFVSMGNLIADGLYQLADPRIAQGQR